MSGKVFRTRLGGVMHISITYGYVRVSTREQNWEWMRWKSEHSYPTR